MGRNIQKFAIGAIEFGAGALIDLVPGGQGVGLFLMHAGLATTAQGATHPMRILSAPADRSLSAGSDRCA